MGVALTEQRDKQNYRGSCQPSGTPLLTALHHGSIDTTSEDDSEQASRLLMSTLVSRVWDSETAVCACSNTYTADGERCDEEERLPECRPAQGNSAHTEPGVRLLTAGGRATRCLLLRLPLPSIQTVG